jgi:hypothetical protein
MGEPLRVFIGRNPVVEFVSSTLRLVEREGSFFRCETEHTVYEIELSKGRWCDVD